MVTRIVPSVPLPRPVRSALEGSDTLSALLKRRGQSLAMWEMVRHEVPESLVSSITIGALDEHQWHLVAAHASAAAKLRQLVPTLESALAKRGLGNRRIVVKVKRPTQG